MHGFEYMDFIIGILGKIIGALLLLGLVAWLFALFRAIAGLARSESFSFFLPFGFLSSWRKNRP